MKYFGKFDGTQMQFSRYLAYQLIHNPYDVDRKQKKTFQTNSEKYIASSTNFGASIMQVFW